VEEQQVHEVLDGEGIDELGRRRVEQDDAGQRRAQRFAGDGDGARARDHLGQEQNRPAIGIDPELMDGRADMGKVLP
jgi:hypothetical protein